MRKGLIILIALIVVAVATWFFYGEQSLDDSASGGLQNVENTIQLGTSNREVSSPIESPGSASFDAESYASSADEDVQIEEAPNALSEEQRLLQERELSESIEHKNAQLSDLAENYSEDLNNPEARKELSEAIKQDKEYREQILEKFKIEREADKEVQQ